MCYSPSGEVVFTCLFLRVSSLWHLEQHTIPAILHCISLCRGQANVRFGGFDHREAMSPKGAIAVGGIFENKENVSFYRVLFLLQTFRCVNGAWKY